MTIVSPAASEWRFDRGGDVITGTGTVTGRWRGLQALGTGCTLAAGTAAADLTGTLTGVMIPAGATVNAHFTAVQLSAGSCLLYS
jgi:hypothetical protein